MQCIYFYFIKTNQFEINLQYMHTFNRDRIFSKISLEQTFFFIFYEKVCLN